MKIESFRIAGIRCFDDTRDIQLSPKCNIFVGHNNVGKSTLLKGLLAFQGFPFSPADLRPGGQRSFHSMRIADALPTDYLRHGYQTPNFGIVRLLRGSIPPLSGGAATMIGDDNGMFGTTRPQHAFVPFLARRKAPHFEHNISSGVQVGVGGTFSNLYSRIDLVATAGHPRHEEFKQAVNEIVGLPITTKASQNGKEAGFYLNDDTFVTLDRMGDGVTEMVALIVELCLERRKIFVLEEPETNLHPRGLKALLSMVRVSAEQNQFVIATHST